MAVPGPRLFPRQGTSVRDITGTCSVSVGCLLCHHTPGTERPSWAQAADFNGGGVMDSEGGLVNTCD